MNKYTAQIESVVKAASVVSVTQYGWFGQSSPRLPEHVLRALSPAAARSYLAYTLQWQLYRGFYCPGATLSIPQDPAVPGPGGMTPFVEELAAANRGSGRWDPGWTVLSMEEQAAVVRKDGLALLAYLTELGHPEGEAVEVGDLVSLKFSRDLPGISPGFYMALGNREPETRLMVRLYWNVNSQGALRLMEEVTSRLSDAGLAYNLKVVSNPGGYERCDDAVLYINGTEYEPVSSILAEIYPRIKENMRTNVPSLTKQLVPGLGLAEDPGYGESFGLHRCLVLAEGLVRAHESAERSPAGRLGVVLRCLEEAGIDINRPYLRPGSTDIYDFKTVGPPGSGATPNSMARIASFSSGSEDALSIADGLGRKIIREAIWHEDRCNWVGATQRAPWHSGIRYEALGPDLYAGTAGVGLFLAELHAITSDLGTKRASLGALDLALERSGELAGEQQFGFYQGKAGIAFAAARAGLLFEDERLIEQAGALLASIEGSPDRAGYDLVSGMAGSIAGLLALREIPGGTSRLATAVQLGDRLIAEADKSDAGYSWREMGTGVGEKREEVFAGRNLTGFSHGAAGIGFALLELSKATGDTKYRRAAERAFDYERAYYDARERNWPDFRESRPASSGDNRDAAELRFSTFWCHGAPGIALSRLRAYELSGDERYKGEAEAALATTRSWLGAQIEAETGNYSLCHGLCGNAEVLLYGSRVLERDRPITQDIAAGVAKAGTASFTWRGGRWACGAGGGQTPGLMLGLAGIGLFYLRLYEPTIPTVLLPLLSRQ